MSTASRTTAFIAASASILLGIRALAQPPGGTTAPSLASPDANARAAAVFQLRADVRANQKAIVAALDDADPRVRATAAGALADVRSLAPGNYAIVEKLSALAHGDPSVGVRATCAQTIRQLGFIAYYPPLITGKIASGTDAQKIAAAEFVAGSSIGAEVMTVLGPPLKDPSPAVRRAAADAIARRDPVCGLQLVGDVAHPEIRDAAALQLFWVLRDATPASPSQKQLDALKANADAEIRILGELLGERLNMSDRVPLPLRPLTLAIRHKSSSAIRRLAGRSMMYGMPNDGGARQIHGVVALLAAAENSNPDVAADAICSLECGLDLGGNNYAVAKASNEKLIDTIAQQLGDPADAQRIAALDQLATLPPDQAIALWKQAAALLDDPAPKVSAAARADCRKILTAQYQNFLTAAATTPPPAPATTMTTLPASALSPAAR